MLNVVISFKFILNLYIYFHLCTMPKYRKLPPIRLNCWKKSLKMQGFYNFTRLLDHDLLGQIKSKF